MTRIERPTATIAVLLPRRRGDAPVAFAEEGPAGPSTGRSSNYDEFIKARYENLRTANSAALAEVLDPAVGKYA
jgi:hypothetical protein